MKKLLVGLASVFVVIGAQAQGVVTFNNIGNPITSVTTGEPLGTGWTVDLLVGGEVLASTPTVGGGTFLGSDPVDLGTVDPVDVTVNVYPTEDGSIGVSEWATVTFSAQGGNANASPPEVPTSLGFPAGVETVIPEPSTIALGILGLGALALRRRRNA